MRPSIDSAVDHHDDEPVARLRVDDTCWWDGGEHAKHATAPGGQDPLWVGVKIGALIAALLWAGIAVVAWWNGGDTPAVPR